MAYEALFLTGAALGLLVNITFAVLERSRGRAPTKAEMQEIRSRMPDGEPVPRVRVLSATRFEARVGAGAFGVGRVLFIAERLLGNELEILRPALAHEAGHLRARLLPPDLAPVYQGCLVAISGAFGFGVLAVGVLVTCAAGLAHWRHEEFLADRRSPVPPGALLAQYEWLAAHASPPASPRLPRLPRLLRYPSLEERIAALRARRGRGDA